MVKVYRSAPPVSLVLHSSTTEASPGLPRCDVYSQPYLCSFPAPNAISDSSTRPKQSLCVRCVAAVVLTSAERLPSVPSAPRAVACRRKRVCRVGRTRRRFVARGRAARAAFLRLQYGSAVDLARSQATCRSSTAAASLQVLREARTVCGERWRKVGRCTGPLAAASVDGFGIGSVGDVKLSWLARQIKTLPSLSAAESRGRVHVEGVVVVRRSRAHAANEIRMPEPTRTRTTKSGPCVRHALKGAHMRGRMDMVDDQLLRDTSYRQVRGMPTCTL